MTVFNKYADFYDLYYQDKDYAAEAAFVLKLAKRFACRPRTVLDMGCGTGRHLAEFARRGIAGDGFDRSPRMLSAAKERLAGSRIGLATGDLRTFRNGKRYDLVVSMFAVMGYLIANEDLLDGLATARRHLRPGGVFIFDGWFGPAVLAQKPEARKHTYRQGARQVIRRVTPELDAVSQSVLARYEVTVKASGKAARTIREEHRMRFMFVQEMALAMEQAGLRLVHACPFMQPKGSLSAQTWNVAFVAKRF